MAKTMAKFKAARKPRTSKPKAKAKARAKAAGTYLRSSYTMLGD